MKVAIIQYNAGNTQSVIFALERMGVHPLLTADPEELRSADKVIFPGVGEASSTMRHLRETGLDTLIPTLKQPVLGVCLGMQLMCARSEEGNAEGLGIFDLTVRQFIPKQSERIPHMGWNTLRNVKSDLFAGLGDGDHMYFVHSYYVPDNPWSIGTTDYILPFCSAIARENFYAVQFHPEKSSQAGALVLKNFLAL